MVFDYTLVRTFSATDDSSVHDSVFWGSEHPEETSGEVLLRLRSRRPVRGPKRVQDNYRCIDPTGRGDRIPHPAQQPEKEAGPTDPSRRT